MDDWRLNGQEKYLTNKTFYKIVFPEFWNKAFLEKNKFYQDVLEQATNHVQRFCDTKNYLEDEKIQHFWHEQ